MYIFTGAEKRRHSHKKRNLPNCPIGFLELLYICVDDWPKQLRVPFFLTRMDKKYTKYFNSQFIKPDLSSSSFVYVESQFKLLLRIPLTHTHHTYYRVFPYKK